MSELCDYGCGQEALFQFKNGKRCCSDNWNRCPASKKRRSEALKEACSRSEVRERKSKSAKESWNDPQKRENHIVASNKPESKRKHQQATKKAANLRETKEKKEQTFLLRYGVKYVGQLEKVREESRQRLLSWQAQYMNLFSRDESKLRKLYEATSQRMLGENNPLWNPNREQVFTPYTEKFFDQIYRNQIKREQNYVDPITEEVLTKKAHLHHIDYNKQNDSRENLIWLNLSTHVKTNGTRRNREKWQKTLQEVNSKIIEDIINRRTE